MKLCDETFYLFEISSQPFIVILRELHPVFCVHFIGKGRINNNVIFCRFDKIGFYCGRLFQLNRHKQNGRTKNIVRGGAFFPVDETKCHVRNIDAGFFDELPCLLVNVFYSSKWIRSSVIKQDYLILPLDFPGVLCQKCVFSTGSVGLSQCLNWQLLWRRGFFRIIVLDNFGIKDLKRCCPIYFLK